MANYWALRLQKRLFISSANSKSGMIQRSIIHRSFSQECHWSKRTEIVNSEFYQEIKVDEAYGDKTYFYEWFDNLQLFRECWWGHGQCYQQNPIYFNFLWWAKKPHYQNTRRWEPQIMCLHALISSRDWFQIIKINVKYKEVLKIIIYPLWN